MLSSAFQKLNPQHFSKNKKSFQHLKQNEVLR